MIWRSWAFFCGLPAGAALGLAALAKPTAWQIGLAGIAGGVLLAVIVTLLARRDVEPDRGGHLAAAASAGWYALGPALAIFFAWAPGSWAWAVTVPTVLAIALLRGSRDPGPGRGAFGWGVRAIAAAVLGLLAVLAIAAGFAALGAHPVEPGARFASTLYSIDAGVVTRPLPECGATPLATRVLRPSGAHPTLTSDDRFLFFDAPVDGRRQIHRLDRSNGDLLCWTCGDPGNNTRPSINSSGVSMVFESDRDATWRHPDETEIYLAGVAKRVDVADPGRRLSFLPGPDTNPIFGPGPQMVTWSRREGGRYSAVAASIRSGHGGILLGSVGVLAEGGAQWIAPVAWSADGRALVVVRGNPFAALEGAVVDPVSGATRSLGADVGLGAGANGDGAWLAWATTRSHHPAGALPRALGFALAPLAHARETAAPLRNETGVRAGAVAGPGDATALVLPAEIAQWGEPTGLASASDASAFVIGQRRSAADGVEERLVEIDLACTQVATAPREIPAARP